MKKYTQMYRPIYRTVPSQIAQVGEGMNVLRPLPARGLRKVGPFIMLDHFGPHNLPIGKTGDVPPHPHAGFQTVTYLFKGKGLHRDSSGAMQEILPGGVNWMTAGRGIVHAEQMAGDPTDGKVEGFQIWVDLPRDQKFTAPGFDGMTPEQLPVRNLEGGQVRVIAGNWSDTVSQVRTFSPLFLYHLTLFEGAEVEVPVDPTFAAGIYTAEGEVEINEESWVERSILTVFEPGEGSILVKAKSDAQLMVMGGAPLNQPMASYGPFVMSTQEELQQVMDDYRQGKMGEVEWKE
ncbi:MAG: pirin family protein [Bacteroidota bacterium]